MYFLERMEEMIEITVPSEQTLKFLGRGSMFNVKEGNTSAFWKDQAGKHMVLIDCGCTVFQRIIELNLLSGVQDLNILITHTHSDHIGSLSDLIHYCRFVKPHLQISIFCQMQNTLPLRNYFDATGTMPIINETDNIKLVSLFYKSATISDDEDGLICEFKFVTDKSHKVASAYKMVQPMYSSGITISFYDKTIYYSGDTMHIPFDLITVQLFDEIYVDCAVRDHSPGGDPGTYPHYNLYKMYVDMKKHGVPPCKLYAMHLDCKGVEEECHNFGINVVRNVRKEDL